MGLAKVFQGTPKSNNKKGKARAPNGHQKYYAKLAKRYYGSFQILNPINETTYKSRLPRSWLIHDAFHISLLKKYIKDANHILDNEFPFVTKEVTLDIILEIVLQTCTCMLRSRTLNEYFIKWINYPIRDCIDCTWEREDLLLHEYQEFFSR